MSKFFLLLFILFTPLVLSAQNWKTLNNTFVDQINNGEIDAAIITGEKAKAAALKEFGNAHPNYALTIYELGSAYLQKQSYKKAETLLLQAKQLQEKNPATDPVDYANTISDLATLYVETKQYAKAEPLYRQSLAISEKTTSKNDSEYITVVYNLAILYDRMNKDSLAEPLYKETLSFYQHQPSFDSTELETVLEDLITFYQKKEDYPEVLLHLAKLGDLYLNHYGETSESYTTISNRYGLTFSAIADFPKAEYWYKKNIALRKKVYGIQHPAYASALNNLATHYMDMGQFQAALPLFEEARDIAENNPTKGNFDYITYVNNIALLYLQMGDYEMAEPLLVELVNVKKKIYGENNMEYAVSVNNLASAYFKTGQLEKALTYFTTALSTIRKTAGDQSSEYASTLNNMGLVYANLDQTAKAEAAYLQSRKTWEVLKRTNHPDYLTVLDNLALLYTTTRQDEKAIQFYRSAIESRKKILGNMHPDYAVSLNNLGYFYMDNGQFAKAETLLIESVEILKTAVGQNYPGYAIALNNLAQLYMRMKLFDKAAPLLLQSAASISKSIQNSFSIFSETEKQNFLDNNKPVFETTNTFLFRSSSRDTALLKRIFNFQIGLKSAALSDTKNMISALLHTNDTATRRLFQAWLDNRKLLAKQLTLPTYQRRNDVPSIEAQTEEQEKKLNMASASFRSQQNELQVSYDAIKSKLGDKEAAIEFVRFRVADQPDHDSIIYAAYIIRKDRITPSFVPVCEEKQIESLFKSAGTNTTQMVKTFYRGLGGTNDAGMGESALYNLVWKPIESSLEGINTISYAPAGKFYSIAFHALPIDSTHLLIDKYHLKQYVSTREIAFRENTDGSETASSITLFGNPAFSMDSIQLVKQRNSNRGQATVTLPVSIAPVRGGAGTWNELPGTGREADAIYQLFQKERIPAFLYTGQQATEEELKKLSSKSTSIIHIATHGFFLPPPKGDVNMVSTRDNAYTKLKNPLLRSGLVLAGGNYTWSGKKPIDGIEDGIVTAYEIAQLDLSRTQLVVLSACETALGDVKGSEGVFGLQRAFKLAGCKKMIVSLWQVPDRETAELMTLFYSKWLTLHSIDQAFSAAQEELRKKYSAVSWAAFVLIE